MSGWNTGLRAAMLGSAAVVAVAGAPSPAFAQERAQRFDIRPQGAAGALNDWARQASSQIVFPYDAVEGRRSDGLRGTFTPREALARLTQPLGLEIASEANGIVTLRATGRAASGEGEAGSAAAESGSAEGSQAGIAEILVVGSRSQNADIRRSEDDAQPYVVLSRRDVEQSGATSLEDFLNTRLPMNATQPQSLSATLQPNRSAVNLRGLGTNQTLILVNGRRLPAFNDVATLSQSDINGIPLSSIERIEVLPTTASGIYGGGATGGVINIITRSDYSGAELSVGYGNTSRWDSEEMRIDGNAGFNLEGGRTNIFVAASHRRSGGLLAGDRDLTARGRALQFANDPTAFLTGASPISGATTNIRNANGANLVLRDGTALNSPVTFLPVGYAGYPADGGAALIANAGRYNIDLPEDILGTLRSELPEVEASSLSGSVRRRFGEWLTLFADASWYRNRGETNSATSSFLRSVTIPAGAPNNPFTTAINVTFPVLGLNEPTVQIGTTFRASAGVIVRLPFNWSVAADYTYGRSRSVVVRTAIPIGDPDGAGPGLSATQAIQNGSLDVLRDLERFPLDYGPYLLPAPNTRTASANYLDNAVLRASGPLFRLPGGPVTLTASVDWRRDRTSPQRQDNFSAAAVRTLTYIAPRSQTNLAYYVEARMPLFGAGNAIPAIRELELQVSVRRDEYVTRSGLPRAVTVSDISQVPTNFTYNRVGNNDNNFTVGSRWVPAEGLTLRASYGTGFLPPAVDQITSNPDNAVAAPFIDPKRGNTTASYTFGFRNGGNPDLVPEESRSWSFGAILEPQFLPGARLSVDYTRIRKVNEIRTLNGIQAYIDLEDQFGRVTRAPLTAADQALGYTGGLVTFIDLTSVNVAQSSIAVVDIQADYRWQWQNVGDFHAYLVATYQPDLRIVAAPNVPETDSAGYAGGVLRWRGNAGLEWRRGPLSLAWNIQYYDSYLAYSSTSNAGQIATAVLNQGAARIPRQIYNDLYIAWRPESGVFDKMDFSLSIQNIFDAEPPILATTGLGGYSTYGDPRLRRFLFQVRRRF